MSIFASAGLVLVGIGVYSVIAYTTARRTHEIGIRMALGATAADVIRLVLGAALRVIVVGIAVGLAGQRSGVLGSRWGIVTSVCVRPAYSGLRCCIAFLDRHSRVLDTCPPRHCHRTDRHASSWVRHGPFRATMQLTQASGGSRTCSPKSLGCVT